MVPVQVPKVQIELFVKPLNGIASFLLIMTSLFNAEHLIILTSAPESINVLIFCSLAIDNGIVTIG